MSKIDMVLWDSSIFTDVFAAAISFSLCTSVILLLRQIYKKGLCDVHLLRKLIHISIGLSVMFFWPIFSNDIRGRILAGFIPSFYSARLLLPQLQDEQVIKFLKRYRDIRELLKATVAYHLAVALVTIFYWRTPLAIAAMCNLCVGDGSILGIIAQNPLGVADIAGRRFGRWKLPYNNDKSFAGSIGMAIAGFFASVLFMYYFSWFGYIEERQPNTVLGFLVVSVASALVESHPLSSKLDDNLTVPLASVLVGTFVF